MKRIKVYTIGTITPSPNITLIIIEEPEDFKNMMELMGITEILQDKEGSMFMFGEATLYIYTGTKIIKTTRSKNGFLSITKTNKTKTKRKH